MVNTLLPTAVYLDLRVTDESDIYIKRLTAASSSCSTICMMSIKLCMNFPCDLRCNIGRNASCLRLVFIVTEVSWCVK